MAKYLKLISGIPVSTDVTVSEVTGLSAELDKKIERVSVDFTHSSLSPISLVTLPANAFVISALVTIPTPWSSASANASLGTTSSPSEYVSTSEFFLDESLGFHFLINKKLTFSTTVTLTLNHAASTSGAGLILLFFSK